MRHFTEEEMIAYEMQESEQAEAVCEHLKVCPECAAVDAEIAETLREFREEPVPAAEFERSWERVRGQLQPARAISFGRESGAEVGVFASLWQGLRDAFFAKKLPPLELQSKPIPVVDRMAVRRDPKSAAIAFAIHAAAILLIGYVVANGMVRVMAPPVKVVTLNVPPPAPMKKDLMTGGGGQRGPTPVTEGELPKIAPAAPRIEQPKIPLPPTVDLDLKMANMTMPNLGDPRSPRVGASMGNGLGAGIGSGNGGGLGAGSGGSMGSGIRQVGGGVSAPVPLRMPEPDFSEEARKAKFQGNVLVYLVVDAKGHPQDVRVAKPVGMGLDEKAVEAVKQYLFKPAMENGKPVPVDLAVDVEFRIY